MGLQTATDYKVLQYKSSTKNLRNMIYESFILVLFILVLALYSDCGDKN